MNELLSGKIVSCEIDSTNSDSSIEKILMNNSIFITKFSKNTYVLTGIKKSKKVKKTENVKAELPFHPNQVISWSGPVLINRKNLIYPILAQSSNIEGEVKLMVYVNSKGFPSHIKITKSSGHSILDSATVDFIKSKQFIPAYANDKPVNVWTTLTFKYNLNYD